MWQVRSGNHLCQTPPLRVVVRLCALVILSLAGCQSTNSMRFQASQLPGDWLAIPVLNVNNVDLSRFATRTTQEDMIHKGDVIEVTISGGLADDKAITLMPRVDERGEIKLLEIGSVPVNGYVMRDAEQLITRLCMEQDIYTSPLVMISMKSPKMNKVTVSGAVEKPGLVELRSGQCDLLHAIEAAGGLAKNAGTSVDISHPGYANGVRGQNAIMQTSHWSAADGQPTPSVGDGSRRLKVDLASFTKTDNPVTTAAKPEYELTDGATVNVEKVDREPIQVFGLVKKPDKIEIPPGKNIKLLGAIAQGGGISNPFADKIFIIRHRPDQPQPALIVASLRSAKKNGAENLVLQPGDEVSVEQTPSTIFYDAITKLNYNMTKPL